MVSVRLTSFVAAAVAACTLSSAIAAPVAPIANVHTNNSLQTRDGGNGHFVVYSDAWVSGQVTLPDPAEIKGFDTFVLSFLLSKSSADQAIFWEQLTDADRKAALDKYHAAGIKVIVSAFGATEMPTSQGFDAVQTANTMADWVIKHSLDGIDVDYEDLDAMNKMDGAAEKWLSDFTTALRAKLPKGQYIITHAPLAPWFSAAHYSTGAYTTVHKNVGDQIDWYNMQYYNQGASEYVDCAGLFDKSSSQWPDTAVFEIADKAGVPLDKLVVGKPAGNGDASNGFMDAATLGGCMGAAKGKGWNGGAMVWQFPHAKTDWAMAVRGSAFPLAGGGVTPPPPSGPTTTAPPTTTTSPPQPPPGGDNCGSAAAWDAGKAYTGGAKVSYNGQTYTAKWWTQNEKPGSADVWTAGGSCRTARDAIVAAPISKRDCGNAKAYDAGAVYTGGMSASYNGKTYTAKWWTQGAAPGTDDVWAVCGNAPVTPPTTQNPPPPPPPTQGGDQGGPSYMHGEQTGESTFYNTGMTSCGTVESDSGFTAAVSQLLYDTYPGYAGTNPNNNPVCGKKIRVTYQGKSVDVTVRDRCVSCAVTDLDLTPAAFNTIADPNAGRIHGIKWTWI